MLFPYFLSSNSSSEDLLVATASDFPTVNFHFSLRIILLWILFLLLQSFFASLQTKLMRFYCVLEVFLLRFEFIALILKACQFLEKFLVFSVFSVLLSVRGSQSLGRAFVVS